MGPTGWSTLEENLPDDVRENIYVLSIFAVDPLPPPADLRSDPGALVGSDVKGLGAANCYANS